MADNERGMWRRTPIYGAGPYRSWEVAYGGTHGHYLPGEFTVSGIVLLMITPRRPNAENRLKAEIYAGRVMENVRR